MPRRKPSRRNALATLAGALLAVFGLGALRTHATPGHDIRIVVNSGNPGVRIKRAAIRAIFLDAEPRWADGAPVDAVDQPTRSSVRGAFTRQLLRMSVGEFQAHWLRQTLNTGGKVRPPKTKDDDAAVLAFVRENPGAIGYVSPDVVLEPGVKVLSIVE